jgi:beta-glucanase (GH16 family)
MRQLFYLLGFLPFWIQAQPLESGLQASDWSLRFSDAFSGSNLDTSKWVFRTDSKHWSVQKPANCQLANGILQIHLKKETQGAFNYSGGGLISRDSMGYGYYEARLRTPKAEGWHSSFWLMKHNGSGGTSPSATDLELDVLENDSRITLGYRCNLHRWSGASRDFGGHYVSSEGLNQDFQVLGCWYRPDSVIYYYNHKRVKAWSLLELPSSKVHIWLTSIASWLGGTTKVDDAKLPDRFEVDYVRYFVLRNPPQNPGK